MTNLMKEYTDIKNVKHKVEHLVLPADDTDSKEQILKELFHALTRSHKHMDFTECEDSRPSAKTSTKPTKWEALKRKVT